MVADELNRIGPHILLVFFGVLVFGYVYVYLFIPETKGLTLEEVRQLAPLGHALYVDSSPVLQVDEMYTACVKPWNSTSWQPRSRSFTSDSEKSYGTSQEKVSE